MTNTETHILSQPKRFFFLVVFLFVLALLFLFLKKIIIKACKMFFYLYSYLIFHQIRISITDKYWWESRLLSTKQFLGGGGKLQRVALSQLLLCALVLVRCNLPPSLSLVLLKQRDRKRRRHLSTHVKNNLGRHFQWHLMETLKFRHTLHRCTVVILFIATFSKGTEIWKSFFPPFFTELNWLLLFFKLLLIWFFF